MLEADEMLTIPEEKTNEGFLKWINALPQVESPEWSGLPNNAEKLLREIASKDFIQDINRIQSAEDEELSEDKGASTKIGWMVTVEEKASKLLSALPKKVEQPERNEQAQKNPIYRFLKRETGMARKILKLVRNDLTNTIEMCRGNFKPTNEIRNVAKSLLMDELPKVWKMWVTDYMVTPWIMDLIKRISQLGYLNSAEDFGKLIQYNNFNYK